MATGNQSDRSDRLEREEIEDPAKRDSAEDERGKQLRAEAELLFRVVAHQRRKHDGHKQREHDHQTHVRRRHFRPCVISKASSTTSMFSRPATIRKALPYS